MPTIKIHNLEGKETGELKLSEKVFALPMNDELVHQVYVAIYANKRQVLAHTKTRGERAGSGIKPWRQKGTGRARVGSVRTPVWRKGGVVFGPTNERNFKQKVNQKMKEKAIKIVLSGKLGNGDIIVVDKFDFKDKKTKEFAKTLKSLKADKGSLIAFSDSEKDLRKLSRNIEKVENLMVNQLNVFDMLNKKNLVLSVESAKYLEEKYGK